MEVSVRNFGTISHAEVHVGGLTVITGENDTGKSTIGKILFSLVKASARYEEDLEEAKEARIKDIAERMYFNIRRYVNVASHLEFRELFHPRKFYSQLRLDKAKALDERVAFVTHLMEIDKNMPTALYESLMRRLEKISLIMDEPDDEIYVITRAVKKAFFSEFKGEIIHKGGKAPSKAHVTINDGASELIDITWSKDQMQNFKYVDSLGYADATYVDSPAIIQFHRLVKMARTLFDADSSGVGTVPLHIKDLATKLSDSVYNFPVPDFFVEREQEVDISSRIKKVFGGSLSYDDDSSDFVLERNGYKLSSGNIASGIKSLGVLDLLVRGGSIKKNSLLILDEPEVNLHPKWQLDYCDIVCGLVASGVDVIVTTHSPYILEALKHYSDKYGLGGAFYLASKEPNASSDFLDISQNISVAIDRLAAPLYLLNKESFDDF
ncbi:ABC transporter ATP-binding protein [Pseudomonas sp. A-1]|uniref:AAA family ATPase n=1 Tax=Pseudomonas sp. A-1 TaxID=1821274 RepID=UPI0010A608D0|nr:AAA family ATPase [Pseudomonas sp. A-1]THG83481.1 ABC transporter ATP-binding protein [Pseudomonas sp. A-1]